MNEEDFYILHEGSTEDFTENFPIKKLKSKPAQAGGIKVQILTPDLHTVYCA
jgi:hypothetical protein